MFLKSLVLRGFKSFADKTILQLEPGLTVVVGPNGSGKSNVVDAISWVLGEQGPRALRGGKMEDVIFAGSRLRPALGMAEVTLTIDNSAHLLAVDLPEVSVSRTLFRSGESEYSLNGAPCRLLDVQELLSDTGIGREKHTIVGQGQLDDVLASDPMQLRILVEEAAGVAKHRRRKERSLRKIAAAEANLSRIGDRVAEIRRQLRPLREQAEVARRHQAMVEELGRARLVMACRELAGVWRALGPGGMVDLEAPLRETELRLAALEREILGLESELSGAFQSMQSRREAAWTLAQAAERLRGIARLAGERERTFAAKLSAATEDSARAQITTLEREAAAAARAIEEAAGSGRLAASRLEAMETQLESAEQALRGASDSLDEAQQRQRDRASELIRIRGDMAAVRSSLESARREAARAADRRGRLVASRADAQAKVQGEKRTLEELESAEAPLAEALQSAEEQVAAAESARQGAIGGSHEAENAIAHWEGRMQSRGEASGEHAGEVLRRAVEGVVGRLSDLVDCPPDLVPALEALAGRASGVLVVSGPEVAERVLAQAGPDRLGLLAGGPGHPEVEGLVPLRSFVRPLHPLAADALKGVFLAEDGADAARKAARHHGAIFVTRDGAMAVGRLVSAPPGDAALGTARARQAHQEALERVEASRSALAAAVAERDRQARSLNELDAARAAAMDSISALERELHALDREEAEASEASARAGESISLIEAELATLEEALPQAEAGVSRMGSEVERCLGRRAEARSERDGRLGAVQSATLEVARSAERQRLLTERKEALAEALEAARVEAAGLAGRRQAISAAIEKVRGVADEAGPMSDQAAAWAAEAESGYQDARAASAACEAGLGQARERRRALTEELELLRTKAREEDLARTELRVRARVLEDRLREESGVDPADAVSRWGHAWEVEDPSRLADPLERLAALDGAALGRKAAKLEREMSAIGTINPLAAQDFEALSEREVFLDAQMKDLRSSRRDLLKVVAEVDERVREMFAAAFRDVASEYERLFAAIFPGGQGRLRLTDPSDMLATGIEVEARPAGKNIKRLSLLSGGERALAALAVLFAIFKARPSPFYVLDEVEAALDDLNLQRFLGLLAGFRGTSQLLVVTHQKRTMEVADVLYGVSIRSDGASRVISQRLAGIPGSLEPAQTTDVPA